MANREILIEARQRIENSRKYRWKGGYDQKYFINWLDQMLDKAREEKSENVDSFAGVVEDVKKDVDFYFKEKFKYAEKGWIEIDIKLKNVD